MGEISNLRRNITTTLPLHTRSRLAPLEELMPELESESDDDTPIGVFFNTLFAGLQQQVAEEASLRDYDASHPSEAKQAQRVESAKKDAEKKGVIPDAVVKEPSAAQGEPVCLLCADRSTKVVWIPCGHTDTCVTCCREAFANNPYKCPFCNKGVTNAMRIYITAPEIPAAAAAPERKKKRKKSDGVSPKEKDVVEG